MELYELKAIWKEESKKLEERIELNEKLIQEMNMNKTLGEVNKLIETSIWGRNLALVYCAISIGLASCIISELEYSLPAMIGACAMLWSFISHLPIKKPDFKNDSVLALQKAISKFRIHTAANANFDIFITLLWFLTLLPLVIRLVFNYSLYSDMLGLVIFSVASIGLVLFINAQSKKIYSKYEEELSQSVAYLTKIKEFENG